MTTSGQICKMSYTAYSNTYCNMGQPYCNICNMLFAVLFHPQQEGHDGPVSLHWLIFGNFFKTYDPEEGLKLVATSSTKQISKYFTK